MVFIKTVPLYSKDSQEYAIWRMLDSPEARSHPDNHTVPVREILYFRPDFTTVGVASEPTDTRLFVVMDRFDKVTALDDIPITKSCYPFDIMDKNLLLDRTSTVDRCYAIDFQFSLYFPKPWTTAPRILVDAEAPEAFRPKKPYDPFPVDVFCVGTIYITMVKALQIAGWTSLDKLEYLAESMRENDPQQRPTIHVVEENLLKLIETLSSARALKTHAVEG
ncbi:hypothetical protein FRC05_003440 [Tulasnella sp. 425]|nr:hypothetical protein FRC05_003440 [Tulasnella sp. 425]